MKIVLVQGMAGDYFSEFINNLVAKIRAGYDGTIALGSSEHLDIEYYDNGKMLTGAKAVAAILQEKLNEENPSARV